MDKHYCKLTFLVISFLLIFPTLCIYYSDYSPKIQFNNNCFKTNCTINDKLITRNKHNCFDGVTLVYFNDHTNLTKNRFLIVYRCESESFILSKFIHMYAINDTIDCYYNQLSDDIYLNLFDLSINFDHVVAFIIIDCFVALVGIFIMLICMKNNDSDVISLKYRSRKIKVL